MDKQMLHHLTSRSGLLHLDLGLACCSASLEHACRTAVPSCCSMFVVHSAIILQQTTMVWCCLVTHINSATPPVLVTRLLDQKYSTLTVSLKMPM